MAHVVSLLLAAVAASEATLPKGRIGRLRALLLGGGQATGDHGGVHARLVQVSGTLLQGNTIQRLACIQDTHNGRRVCSFSILISTGMLATSHDSMRLHIGSPSLIMGFTVSQGVCMKHWFACAWCTKDSSGEFWWCMCTRVVVLTHQL